MVEVCPALAVFTAYSKHAAAALPVLRKEALGSKGTIGRTLQLGLRMTKIDSMLKMKQRMTIVWPAMPDAELSRVCLQNTVYSSWACLCEFNFSLSHHMVFYITLPTFSTKLLQ